MYWAFGSMGFLAPRVQGLDVLEPLQAPPDFVDESRGALFVFLPERSKELVWVKALLPDGDLWEFHNPLGHIRFLLYQAQPTRSSTGSPSSGRQSSCTVPARDACHHSNSSPRAASSTSARSSN
jgi:hypothetical protein